MSSITEVERLTMALEGILEHFDTSDLPFTVATVDGVAVVAEPLSEAVEAALQVLYGDPDYNDETEGGYET